MDDGQRNQRRGSLSRAFSKVKDVFKRRSSTARASSSAPLPSTTEQPAQPATDAPARTETVAAESTMPPQNAQDTMVNQSQPDVVIAPLVLDDSGAIEVGDNSDESVEPIATLPSGFSSERTRAVFDRYGIKYNTPTESTTETKRVERAIRIRIHWTCHECQTSFGRMKTCAKCGHRRCKECARSPAKRVKQILEGTTQLKEIEEQLEAPPSTDINEAIINPKLEMKESSRTRTMLRRKGHWKWTL